MPTQCPLIAAVEQGLIKIPRTTNFHQAAFNGNNARVAAILKHQAVDINELDCFGYTPLALAALGNRPKTIALLVKHGANLEVKQAGDLTALHIAVINEKVEAVQALIDCGANIHAETDFQRTALHAAKYYRNFTIVKLLKTAR